MQTLLSRATYISTYNKFHKKRKQRNAHFVVSRGDNRSPAHNSLEEEDCGRTDSSQPESGNPGGETPGNGLGHVTLRTKCPHKTFAWLTNRISNGAVERAGTEEEIRQRKPKISLGYQHSYRPKGANCWRHDDGLERWRN